jgi:hypothetical protein
MGIPTFLVFDADGHVNDPGKRLYHQTDNERILKLHGSIPPVPFPPETIYLENLVMWNTNIEKNIKADYSETQWEECKNEALRKYDNMRDINKDVLLIADLLEILYAKYGESKTLATACNLILDFAKARSPQLKNN